MQSPQANKLNRLCITRKKIGLGQKTVARLLGHRTTSVISEYETARVLPNLRMALKLSVIYDAPLAELYRPLYSQVCNEVEAARERLPSFKWTASNIPSSPWTPNSIS